MNEFSVLLLAYNALRELLADYIDEGPPTEEALARRRELFTRWQAADAAVAWAPRAPRLGPPTAC